MGIHGACFIACGYTTNRRVNGVHEFSGDAPPQPIRDAILALPDDEATFRGTRLQTSPGLKAALTTKQFNDLKAYQKDLIKTYRKTRYREETDDTFLSNMKDHARALQDTDPILKGGLTEWLAAVAQIEGDEEYPSED